MDKQKTLLEFPCDFPIKVMGKNSANFANEIKAIFIKHFPQLNEDKVNLKPSKGNKYLSVSVTVNAQSKEQLDNLYQELTAHPQVVMAL